MIKQQCSAVIDYKRCKNHYRSRIKHDLCRSCHRRIKQSAREIESRAVIHGANRRTKSRRGNSSKPIVAEVIQNRNNRNKNANQ